MQESMWSRSYEDSVIAPADWIKNNMYGDVYSVDLGRTLTDAEIRFQKSLEQLPVPLWYLTYSKKKPSIRQNCIPVDKRPSTWKELKLQSSNNHKKSPKNRSPKCSPKNSDSEGRVDSGFNETYPISRRTPKKNKSPCISITSSSSDDEPDTQQPAEQDKSLSPVNLSLNRTPRPGSFTFPRVTPSRKIENLNIVFSRPFPTRDNETPPQPERYVATEPRTVYTKTKDVELGLCQSDASSDDSHTTYVIADVDPEGVHPRIHVSASLTTNSSPSPSSSSSSSSSSSTPVPSSDEEASNSAHEDSPSPRPPWLPARCSPSPNTRFFVSHKKSKALEDIVQRSLGKPRGSLVHDIIGELEQSTTSAHEDDFSRSVLDALKESFQEDDDDDDDQPECRREAELADGDVESGSDSDLANSVDISIKFSGGEEESADDQPTSTPLPRVPSARSGAASVSPASSDEEVHWIPTWLSKVPRSSSRQSVLSRASGRSLASCGARSNSPGLSPVRRDGPEDWFGHPGRCWGYTYCTRKSRSPKLPLFRIDETGALDSGYSDTASSRRTAPSRAATVASTGNRCERRYSPDISIGCSSTLVEHDAFNDAVMYNKSGPYVLKSFFV